MYTHTYAEIHPWSDSAYDRGSNNDNNTLYVCIYIYIYRERERLQYIAHPRLRPTLSARLDSGTAVRGCLPKKSLSKNMKLAVAPLVLTPFVPFRSSYITIITITITVVTHVTVFTTASFDCIFQEGTGSVRFGSGHSTNHRFGSVRFGLFIVPVRRGSACAFRLRRGSVRFGSVRFRVRFRPVPKLNVSVRFGRFGSVRCLIPF